MGKSKIIAYAGPKSFDDDVQCRNLEILELPDSGLGFVGRERGEETKAGRETEFEYCFMVLVSGLVIRN
jgi:hypothetical protein